MILSKIDVICLQVKVSQGSIQQIINSKVRMNRMNQKNGIR
jgi:hypothetical protein